MSLFKWSKTAATNATADATINWAEGMAPSGINDSGRAMMAAAAKWRDDIQGIIVSGGSGTAYTVSSNQVITSNVNGFMVQFTPGTTNTGAVTLSVDGQTAKPLRFLTGVDLPAGVLISGSLYQASYRLSTEEWLLHSFDASIYAIPICGAIDYWGTVAPNGAFVFPAGQAISRTLYATCFSRMGTTHGVGDGSTTFNLPDKTGRVSVMKEAAATRLTSSYFGGNSTNLGAVGGAESLTLTANQVPSITSANTAAIALSVTTTPKVLNGPNTGSATAGGSQITVSDPGSGGAHTQVASTGNLAIGVAAVTSNNTGGAAHRTVQPSIVCNYIIRVL